MNQTQNNPPKKKEKKGFIKIGSTKKEETPPEVIKLNTLISDLNRRLRVLEERHSTIRKKMQVTEQNMLLIQRKLVNEIKTTDSEVLQLEKSASNIQDKIKQIQNELSNFSPSEDLKIISRYLDFWQPVGFITKREAEKLVRDIIEENRKI